MLERDKDRKENRKREQERENEYFMVMTTQKLTSVVSKYARSFFKRIIKECILFDQNNKNCK